MLSSRLCPAPRHRPEHAGTSSNKITGDNAGRDDNSNDDGQGGFDGDETDLDLFGSFLPHLFPDDAPQFHGDPGQRLLYSSPRWGDLEVMVPGYPGDARPHTDAEPSKGLDGEGTDVRIDSPAKADQRANRPHGDVEDGRRLFAHYLWSAALVVAEGIERTAVAGESLQNGTGNGDDSENDTKSAVRWDVSGKKVLELGAGAALPSILSICANASTVTITDHPSSSMFSSGATKNSMRALAATLPGSIRSQVSVHPHEWGTLDASDAFVQKYKGDFDRVIAADCLWMRWQHENLVKTLLWFLKDPRNDDEGENDASTSGPGGQAWVVGGFHTGRECVASFFETAVQMGLVVEKIWERDLSAQEHEGEVVREWKPVREDEGPDERRRWCVLAFLRKANPATASA